jgi:hypothetical protein
MELDLDLTPNVRIRLPPPWAQWCAELGAATPEDTESGPFDDLEGLVPDEVIAFSEAALERALANDAAAASDEAAELPGPLHDIAGLLADAQRLSRGEWTLTVVGAGVEAALALLFVLSADTEQERARIERRLVRLLQRWVRFQGAGQLAGFRVVECENDDWDLAEGEIRIYRDAPLLALAVARDFDVADRALDGVTVLR